MAPPSQELEPPANPERFRTDTLDELSEQTGMNRGDLLSGLSQHLPRFVDQLTPDGRLPTDEEANRMV